MQDDDTIRKRCQIDHAKRARTVADAQFANARADCPHRLPIVGLQAALNPVELITRSPARASGKFTEPRQGIANELDGFQRNDTLYQNRYNVNLVSMGRGFTRHYLNRTFRGPATLITARFAQANDFSPTTRLNGSPSPFAGVHHTISISSPTAISPPCVTSA